MNGTFNHHRTKFKFFRMTTRCLGLVRRFSDKMGREQILARQATLDLISRPPEFAESTSLLPKKFDPEFYLQNHPDPDTALRIRTQMDELAEFMERVNARQQTSNQAIVWAATMFLTSSILYSMYQLGDVNTTFTSSIPSLFQIFEYSTARRLMAYLAAGDMLPVDYASEDPYMVREIEFRKHHPKTRPMRVCIPIGLGAGIDLDGIGPAGFIKIGFGFVEVGTVSVRPTPAASINPKVHLLPLSIVSSQDRLEASSSFSVVADRVCDYIEFDRPSDLLSRNSVTGLCIRVSDKSDVAAVFTHHRLIRVGDYISLDVSHCTTSQVNDIITEVNSQCEKFESIPPIYLKVGLAQSFPPDSDIASAITQSGCIVGVNVNGEGVASGKKTDGSAVFPGVFEAETDLIVSGSVARDKATQAVSEWYRALGGKKFGKEIIASGGVGTGKDALSKIEAGASMVSVFTAFVLDGFPVARRIKTQLSVQLMNQSYTNIEQAIGASHNNISKLRKTSLQRRKRF